MRALDSRRSQGRISHNSATALALGLVLASGCGSETSQGPPAPVVTVDTPVRRDVIDYAYFTGNTDAFLSVDVRARVNGELREVYFEPSALVDEGDPLFLIEPDYYRATLDQAAAAVASAEAEAQRTETELRRLERALETDAVSAADVDRARALRDQALASVVSSEAQRVRAQLDFDYTTVRAPIAGRVGRALVDPGNLVSGTGQDHLVTVNQIDPIFVYFEAAERYVRPIAADAGEVAAADEAPAGGTPLTEVLRRVQVEIGSELDDGYPHVGFLDFVDNRVDATTGTISLRGRIPNPAGALVAGLFVRVRLSQGETRSALMIKEVAVGRDISGPFLLLVDESGVVQQHYVELGTIVEDGLVEVASGLEGTERYITNGLLRARPGFPVTPQSANAAPAGGN